MVRSSNISALEKRIHFPFYSLFFSDISLAFREKILCSPPYQAGTMLLCNQSSVIFCALECMTCFDQPQASRPQAKRSASHCAMQGIKIGGSVVPLGLAQTHRTSGRDLWKSPCPCLSRATQSIHYPQP